MQKLLLYVFPDTHSVSKIISTSKDVLPQKKHKVILWKSEKKVPKDAIPQKPSATPLKPEQKVKDKKSSVEQPDKIDVAIGYCG